MHDYKNAPESGSILFAIKFAWGKRFGGGNAEKLLMKYDFLYKLVDENKLGSGVVLFFARLLPSIPINSVSCLYGLGDPIDYRSMVISLRVGQEYPIDNVLRKLAEIRYERNDIDFSRNKFRLRGDTLEVYPAYWSGRAIRVEFFGDEVERITEIHTLTGSLSAKKIHYLFPYFFSPSSKNKDHFLLCFHNDDFVFYISKSALHKTKKAEKQNHAVFFEQIHILRV